MPKIRGEMVSLSICEFFTRKHEDLFAVKYINWPFACRKRNLIRWEEHERHKQNAHVRIIIPIYDLLWLFQYGILSSLWFRLAWRAVLNSKSTSFHFYNINKIILSILPGMICIYRYRYSAYRSSMSPYINIYIHRPQNVKC